MFANDKSIDNLEALFKEAKKYILLQKECLRLELVEKLTVLTSALLLILVLIILCMMALFYFSFMLVYVLESFTGSLIGSYAIIGGFLLLLALLVYRLRARLITRPMVRFLARLFLEEPTNNQPHP